MRLKPEYKVEQNRKKNRDDLRLELKKAKTVAELKQVVEKILDKL